MKIRRLTDDTLVAQALGWLAGAIFRHRGWFVYPQLILFAGSVFYAARCLKLDTSRAHLTGSGHPYHENFERYRREFGVQDDLVVMVESEDHRKNRQFVERLGSRLEEETNLFRRVFFRGDLKMLGPKALLFLQPAELVELRQTLAESRPFIQQVSRATNLVSLFDLVNEQFRLAQGRPNSENLSLAGALPALEQVVTEAAASLDRPGNPPSPGVHVLFGAKPGAGDANGRNAAQEAEQRSYVTFAGGRIYLVNAQALRPELNAQAVRRLRVLMQETQREVPGLNVGLTGDIVLEHDEMEQSRKDTTLASVVALGLCALIFIYGYQEVGRPLKATLCLVVGVGFTLAYATWTVGHLNVLTITFVPILIGLAIDYGVHLISRYEEELRRGKTQWHALHRAMVYTGRGILTGALTTAGAFWAMTFTHFKGIQEMGVICGGGLLICLVPMMTMLPALLLQGRRQVIGPGEAGRFEQQLLRLERIENLWLRRPALVSGLAAGLCALAITQFPRVRFDYNLLHMQSAGLPAVEFEKKLLDSANRSLLFGTVMADNLQEAPALMSALTNLPAVAAVESITQRLSQDQRRQLELVREIKAELAPVSLGPADPRPVDVAELSRTLYSLSGYLGLAYPEVQDRDPNLAGQVASLREAINRLRKEMLQGPPAQLERHSLKLAAFQTALIDDMRETLQALKDQESDSPLRAQDLPSVLHDRFIGSSGKYLLMIYPTKDLRDRRNQEEFIRQVRTVYPDVSGTPIQLYYYTGLLKRSYEEAAGYALAAIVVLVLIHFRKPICVALALVPVVIGCVWLGGIMGWLRMPFNPANIMVLPLIIGIGVTNGIQVLNRFAEEQAPGMLTRSTGKAVIVSALTSIAGFGSLMVARHQGIQSLGYIMSCGLATCMIAGLAVLPAILNGLSRWPGRKRPAGQTLAGSK